MYNNPNIISADEAKMYQTHGDHIEVVVDTELFIRDYLQRIIAESKLVDKIQTDVKLEDPEAYITNVFSLLYGESNLGFIALIATDKAKTSNQFVSAYPVYLGKRIHVKVEKVWVWSNLIEATIECSIKHFQFSFFATDYYRHKHDYVPGKEIDINIGAWGLRIEEADRGFTFEGQQAIDFLAKTGETPNYDENGDVIPVRFNTENLVAFFPLNEQCPEEPEFQSPASEIREKSLLGESFWETDIFIHRDYFDVKIPLLFKKEMVPDAKAGMPLRGFMWLVGAI